MAATAIATAAATAAATAVAMAAATAVARPAKRPDRQRQANTRESTRPLSWMPCTYCEGVIATHMRHKLSSHPTRPNTRTLRNGSPPSTAAGRRCSTPQTEAGRSTSASWRHDARAAATRGSTPLVQPPILEDEGAPHGALAERGSATGCAGNPPRLWAAVTYRQRRWRRLRRWRRRWRFLPQCSRRRRQHRTVRRQQQQRDQRKKRRQCQCSWY